MSRVWKACGKKKGFLLIKKPEPWKLNSNATLKNSKRKFQNISKETNQNSKERTVKISQVDFDWDQRWLLSRLRRQDKTGSQQSCSLRFDPYMFFIPPALPDKSGGSRKEKHAIILRTQIREFDPGSGWTLAACLTHASRTELFISLLKNNLVADGWVTRG